MKKILNFEKTDRKDLLDWIEERTEKRKNKELNQTELELGYYSEIKTKLDNGYQPLSGFYLNDCLEALEEAFRECNFHQSEIILKMMPDEFKDSRKYTQLLDTFLISLYRQMYIQNNWQPCKAAIIEQMCSYHQNKEIRLTGLEIMISKAIGSGVGDNDIGYELCQMTNCEWIWDSYLNAQDAEGHRIPDPYCPVHGDKFYTPEIKKELWKKWNKLIKNYEGWEPE